MMTRWIFIAGVLPGLLMMCGCSGRESGPEMRTVSGRVMLDGTALKSGEVVFRPTDGTGRASAGRIENGRFSFSSTLGPQRVTISSMAIAEGEEAAVGGTEGDPIGPDNPATVYVEQIPPQYNSDSTLNVDVTANGANEFNFELESEP